MNGTLKAMVLDLDPGLANLGNPRLIRAIVEEMAGGAIPFERFMELALYHPEWGYYKTPGRIGPQGDFVTSPAVHAIFGWAVGAWCHATWQALGRPRELTIVEPGAGDGRLASTILDWAEGRDPEFARAISYVALEPNARGSDTRVHWATELPPPAGFGIVVANELFDAFPVRMFDAGERGPAEVMVRWDGEHFAESRGPLASIEAAPGEGRFEVNQRTYPTMRSLCRLFERGTALVFDYGYEREELWAPWRTTGTLLCFYRHTAHEDPYIHVGEQDMTAHVDFSELSAAAEDEGCDVHGPLSQGEFLMRLGIGGLVDAARSDLGEYFVRRRALEKLTDGAGLGRIRVLAATRGIDGPMPGFEPV